MISIAAALIPLFLIMFWVARRAALAIAAEENSYPRPEPNLYVAAADAPEHLIVLK